MFLCIFAFLILNSSYRSFGVPIPTKAPESLADLLTALANSCENVFLSDQIKSKVKYCAELSSPHGEKQLECLIFYDINSQLCAAVGASKLALTDDYSAKINEELDVNLVCGSAKEWVFSNITGFTRYKNSIEKIFKHPVTCGKICGLEDLMSDDANFYCKYFKWGTEMLKQVNVLSTQENSAQLPPETGNNENEPNISSNNDLLDVQIKNSTTSNTPNVPSEVALIKSEEIGQTAAVKPVASSENNKVSETLSANSASEKLGLKTVVEGQVPVVQNPPVASEQADKPPQITNPDLKIKGENKPEAPDTAIVKPGGDNSQKSEVDNEINLLNSELEHKESVLETPAGQSKGKEPPSDVDDYQDSVEAKEGLVDTQGGDDSEDPLLDEENKINKLEEQKEEKKEEHRESQNFKTIVSGITGESGLYPSFGGQDGYSDDDDDDDHFFSFFLTGVIMVAVIYVLYHNKNKVAKVFFGLILEGRQSGRRRNSRGHAYRRLDTLEQAMSTNTAAPPSKIIY